MYYIYHVDRPEQCFRVCRNSRAAFVVVTTLNHREGKEVYKVSETPLEYVSRVVTDFGTPAEQVFGRLS